MNTVCTYLEEKVINIGLKLFFAVTTIFICIELDAQNLDQKAPNKFKDVLTEGREKFKMPAGTKRQGWKVFERAMHEQHLNLNQNGEMINFSLKNKYGLDQTKSMRQFNSEWENLGPFHSDLGVGRVNDIAFADIDTWYAASAAGGLWRTDNAGSYLPGFFDEPWVCLTNELPIQAISSVVVNPQNTNEIYILSGDLYNYGVPSLGIFKSSDAGQSWNLTGMTFDPDVQKVGYKLVMHPDDPQIMYACMKDGLYYTTDGWQTYLIAHFGLVYDLEFKTDDSNVLFFCDDTDVYTSDDALGTIQSTGDAWLEAGTGRIEIDVCPMTPDVIYAVSAKANDTFGMFSTYNVATQTGIVVLSEDCDYGGNIFYQDFNRCDKGQGTYNLTLAVDPENPLAIYIGAVDLVYSNDGGSNWTVVGSEVHSDKHFFEFNPYTSQPVIGCDGGIWVYSYGDLHWYSRNHGLQITQYYHFDAFNPTYYDVELLAGGSQDNGTSFGDLNAPYNYELMTGGDGFNVHFTSHLGQKICYSESQRGALYLNTYIEPLQSWVSADITVLNEEGDPTEGAWDTPYERGQWSGTDIAVGYRDLFYRQDMNDNWHKVWDATNGALFAPHNPSYNENSLIQHIGWGSSSDQIGFVIHDEESNESDIWLSQQFAENAPSGDINAYNWSVWNVVDITGFTNVLFSDLVFVDQSNGNESAVVTCSGYNDSLKVFQLIGDTIWQNISYNLPNVPIRTATTDLYGIYVGTNIGVYFKYYGDNDWVFISQNMPVVPVTQIRVEHDNDARYLYISTYGRGIWRTRAMGANRQTLYFVDHDAQGANDGTSWENAHTSLLYTFDAIQTGDTIFIAAGSYFATYSNNNVANRNIPFLIPKKNLKIYGGFEGWETSPNERIAGQNETILSGDNGLEGDHGTNSYHVIYTAVGHYPVFDRITIADGNADGSGNEYSHQGGAIRMSSTIQTFPQPVVFRDCIFRNNRAESGGAVYYNAYGYGEPSVQFLNCRFELNEAQIGAALCTSSGNELEYLRGSTKLIIRDCEFVNNTAYGQGGAIANDTSDGGISEYSIENCTFDSNSAGATGGAVYNYAGRNNSNYVDPGFTNMQYLNCTFVNNSSTRGGAIADESGLSQADLGVTNSTVENCTFENNYSISYGGSIFADASSNTSNATLILNNSNFFDSNSGAQGGAIYFNAGNYGTGELTMNLCSFDSCDASSDGGVLYMESFVNGNINFVVDSCIFQFNAADKGGALHLSSGGTGSINAQFSYSDFGGNHANGPVNNSQGGAVLHEDGSGHNAIYNFCNFENNVSNMRGGAVYYESNDVTFNNCNFIENAATLNGGAIYVYFYYSPEENFTNINNCFFTGNNSSSQGGAFYATTSNSPALHISAVNSTFDSNSGTDGGSISVSGSGGINLTVDTCIFTNNVGAVGSAGGALFYNAMGSIGITNSMFDGNSTGSTGGSLELLGNTGQLNIQIENCDFLNGNANIAGSLHIKNTNFSNIDADIVNCEFVNNVGNQGIGAVSMESYAYCDYNVSNCTFSLNSSLLSNYSTGALYFKSFSISDTSLVNVSNTSFIGNSAVGSAGALHYVSDGSFRSTMDNCIFENNSTNIHGGAIRVYTYSGNFIEMDIKNSIFKNNSALDKGGAILFETTTSTSECYANIDQCLFIGNDGDEGAAVHVYSTGASAINSIVLRNSTIADNHATTKCGGISGNRTNGTMTLSCRNSILWNNTDGDVELNEKQLYKSGTVVFNIGNSDVQNGLNAGLIDGFGNISLDPLFLNSIDIDGVDNFLPTSDDGFSLSPTSPCIDAADVQFVSIVNDIAGTLRPQINGMDIGAYEALLAEQDIPCLGDLNNDGLVNANDLLMFMTAYGTECEDCVMDINGDGLVNTNDLLLLISNFGSVCD